ncbi:hypothetical protein [Aquimarina sp. MMG016]|nr:hypothetical protein [Aquimarina sp. MMG016]
MTKWIWIITVMVLLNYVIRRFLRHYGIQRTDSYKIAMDKIKNKR